MNRVKKDRDAYITRKMIAYVKPYWKGFLVSLIMILMISAFQLIRPYIIKVAIDKYMKNALIDDSYINQSMQGIKFLSILYLLLIIGEFILSYFQTYILQSTGKKIIMNLREKIFSKIQKLPLSYFDKNSVGRIVTTVTNDTDALNEMFTDVVVGFVQNVFIMIGIIFVMGSLNLNLTVICLAVTPLMFFATIIFKKRARKTFSEIRNKLAVINSFISETISGIKLVQAFNMENKKYKEFESINKEYYKVSSKQIVLFGIFRPFMNVVKTLSLALILLYGGMKIIEGVLEVGTLYAFINYINRLFQPIIELTDQYNTYQSSIVSADRIFSLLDEEEEKTFYFNKSMDKLKGEIEFKNVWFAYDEENWVLKDVSFKINAGSKAAFIGVTGSGKSSIINLICGFYDNQKGEVLIDGINVKNINKKYLRRNIGLVLQDVFLFAGDIENNIKLFNDDITEQQVIKSSKNVNAHNFIRKFEKQYKHKINEKGTVLSMGQRQLISFARALVIQPTILVMDEATSNVDTETEFFIQNSIDKLMSKKTSIAVAHRLSTVKEFDTIMVLEKGRIKECGNHRNLISKKGIYYKLYKIQYSDLK